MSTVAFSMGKAPRSKNSLSLRFKLTFLNIADGSINKTAVSNPGPGSYAANPDKNHRYKSSPAYGVGTARRSEMENKAVRKYPGPNVYDTPSKAIEGPKFHMGTKHQTGGIFQKSIVPGPGAHNPDPQVSQRRSASFSIKGKHKIGTQMVISPDGNHEKVTPGDDLGVPGPGTYSSFKNMHASLSTKFGQERR